ncbi:NADH pyrophosphatase, partial [Streptomyces sp. SID11233]|nr:NADH pyrophosphatase [Streptomyces sp. SID11233]
MTTRNDQTTEHGTAHGTPYGTEHDLAGRPIPLTAPHGIDRAAHHRLDEAWLAAAWSHPR